MASRAEWSKRVERWGRSGLSAGAFAARERLKAKQLSWWRWKLRSSLPVSPPQRREAAAVEFLPVCVTASATPRTDSGSAIEIALPNGRVVRVAAGFDPAMLERVLSIASTEESC